MKITITMTDEFIETYGAFARAWTGETDTGVKVRVGITTIETIKPNEVKNETRRLDSDIYWKKNVPT